MDITPLMEENRQVIQGYGEGRLRISGTVYDHPVLIHENRTRRWACEDTDNLSIDDFSPVLAMAGDLDVVLVGYGSGGRLLQPALRSELEARGLVVETMDTGAACRTYNVLMLEGRRVAALIQPKN